MRRRGAGSVAAMAMVTMVALAWRVGAAELTPVKLTVIPPGANYAEFIVAKAQGIFAKNGLEVELVSVDTVPAGLAATVSGNTQFAFAGPNIVDAVPAGLPVVAIFAIDNVSVGQICALEVIHSAKDLVGKVVALPNRGSAPDVTFRIWLQNAGVSETEVTIRNIDTGTPAMMAAAMAGAVQAFTLNPPRCALVAAAHFKVLADLAATGMKYFNAGVAVSRAYLTQHRDIVERFVASLYQAERLFKESREAAFAAIADQEKTTDPEIQAQAWAFYKKFYADPPAVSEEGLLQAIKYSSSEKTRTAGPAMVKAMYDNSIVEGVIGK